MGILSLFKRTPQLIPLASEPITVNLPEWEEVQVDLHLVLSVRLEKLLEEFRIQLSASDAKKTLTERVYHALEISRSRHEPSLEIEVTERGFQLRTGLTHRIICSGEKFRQLLLEEVKAPYGSQNFLMRGVAIKGRPLELFYEGTHSRLAVIKSDYFNGTHVFDWGFRTNTPDGPRNFNWDKVEKVNFNTNLEQLPFGMRYYVSLEKDGKCRLRWAFEAKDRKVSHLRLFGNMSS